jgi:lipoic acid synthetase
MICAHRGGYSHARPVPAPDANHLSVERFVTPEQFQHYRSWGLARGFRECVSGPLVRSSYRAEQALAGNNVGLTAPAAATATTPP